MCRTLHEISAHYDPLSSGVLVLSLAEQSIQRRRLLPLYCNGALSSIFGESVSSGVHLSPNNAAMSALQNLEKFEPAVLRDVYAHAKHFSKTKSNAAFTIYLAADQYPQFSSATFWTNGNTEANLQANTSSRTVRRRWQEAFVEPVLLADDSDLHDVLGRCGDMQPVGSGLCGLQKVFQLAMCGQESGKSLPRNNVKQVIARKGGLPAVVVIFRPAKMSVVLDPQQLSSTHLGKGRSFTSQGGSPGRMTGAYTPITERASGAFCSVEDVRLSVSGPAAGPFVSSSQRPCHYSSASPSLQVKATNGDTGRSYERVVLSALTPMITAFIADGSRIVYQNALSADYYGHRTRATQGVDKTVALAASSINEQEPPMNSNLCDNALTDMFSLEPAKQLERMLHDVCVEGGLWKGILQVPASCNTAAGHFTSGGTQGCCSEEKTNVTLRNMFMTDDDVSTARVTVPPNSASPHVPPSSASCFPFLPEVAVVQASPICAGAASPGQTLLDTFMGTASPIMTPTAGCEGGQGAWSPLETPKRGRPALRRRNTHELDPLATSTWTLLTDQGGERAKLQSAAVSRTATPRSSMALLLGGRASVIETPTAVGSGAKYQAMAGSNTHAKPDRQVSFGATTTATSCSAMSSHQSNRSLDPQLRPFTPSTSWGATKALECEDGGDDEPRKQLLGRAASFMSSSSPLYVHHGTAAHSPAVADQPVMLMSPTTTAGQRLASGSSVSRVVRFASSLRITPPAVQQVLQQAIGAAGVGGGEGSSATMGSSRPGSLISPEHIQCDSGAGIEADCGRATEMTLSLPPAVLGQQRSSLLLPITDEDTIPSSVFELGEANIDDPRDCSYAANKHDQSSSYPAQPLETAPFISGAASSADPDLMGASGSRGFLDPDFSLVAESIFSRPSNRKGARTGSGEGREKEMNEAADDDEAACGDRPAGSRVRKGVVHPSSSPIMGNAKRRNCDEDCVASLSACTDLRISHAAGAAMDMKNANHAGASGSVDHASPASPASVQPLKPPATASDAAPCWHEVVVSQVVEPHTGRLLIVVVQTDVSAKVVAERHLALVTEAEHRLLEQIFPRHILAYLTEEGGPLLLLSDEDVAALHGPCAKAPRDINLLATSHSEVTLLFADIQGFTPMCKQVEPRVVMTFLNDLFTRFDHSLDEFGVYKVETIGDCYFVAGGLVHEDEDGMASVRARDSAADPQHAANVFMFAKAMLSAAAQVRLPLDDGPVRLRIGIHSGPVVSGVVGERMPRFCLFGDTVNTASRMESTGVAGCIHVSEATKQLLPRENWTPTGGIEVKGKGLMNTYIWNPLELEV